MRNKKIKVVGKGNKEREVFYNELAEFYLHKYLAWRTQHEGISERELLERTFVTSAISRQMLRKVKKHVRT